MLLDMINIVKVRKALLYAFILLGMIFLQDIILSRIELLGVKPFITPIAVAAVGYFTGGVWGAVFGLLAGLSADASLNGSDVMMTVVFPIIGFFSGALPMFLMSRRFISFFIISLGASVLTALCQLFRFLVFTDTRVLPLLVTGVLQVLWSLPFAFVVYYLCRRVSKLDLGK